MEPAVPRAVVTHAHAAHARWGSGRYPAADPGAHLLRTRLGPAADIATVPHGHPVDHNGVRVSSHLRLLCFWLGRKVGVLPASGDFAGAASVPTGRGDRVFAVADGEVIDVSRT